MSRTVNQTPGSGVHIRPELSESHQIGQQIRRRGARTVSSSKWFRLIFVVCAAISWLGCSRPATDSSGAAVTTGGRLVAVTRAEPRSFNRFVTPRAGEELVSVLTQATLVRVNRATGEIEPRLARQWTESPDGLTWTLSLREGVKFSDGQPFSSADVLFTFQVLNDAQAASDLAPTIRVAGQSVTARAADAHTVIITLPAAHGPGLAMLDSVPILPRHKLAAALDGGTFRTAWSATTPPSDLAGLGPFMIEAYVPGQSLALVRNPHFWGRDSQGRALPYLDRVDLRFIPDQSAELLQIQSGAADLTTGALRADDLATLRPAETAGKITLATVGVGVNNDALWFNLTPGAAPARGRPWLQRVELRRAISHAIDRQAIINSAYLGAAEPVWGPVTPGHGAWHLPDLPRTDHDPARAKALLTAIGFTDRNRDAMLEDASGAPVRFTILTQKGHTIRERVVAMFQEQLRQVGLAVDVVTVDPGTLFKHYTARDYDAIYFGFESNTKDPTMNVEFWTSGGTFHLWHPAQKQPATPWEAQIDDLIRRQAASRDLAVRRQLFADAQRVLAEHLPTIHVAAPRVTIAIGSRVHGATPSVLQPPVLWNAELLSVSGGAAGSGHQ
jgi:peptide/nickel transport system substrate-binding protein